MLDSWIYRGHAIFGEDGSLFEQAVHGGRGAEEEKSDDRPAARGGFQTITEGMQDPAPWFVPHVSERMRDCLWLIDLRFRREREIHDCQADEDHPPERLPR